MNKCVMLVTAIVAVATLEASSVATTGVPASAYVQDGLIAQWDGIENAGAGQHDGAATSWKELKGNLATTATALSFNEKGAVFNGTSTSGTLITGNCPAALEAISNGTFTADIYLTPLTYTAYAGIFHFGVYNNTRYFSLTSDNNGVGGSSVFGAFQYKRETWDGSNCYSLDTATVGGTYSIAAIADGSKHKLYRDATLVSSHNAGPYEKYQSTDFQFGKYAARTERQKMNLHSVRLYSRALSEDEIVRNRAIDRVRFEGSDPTDETWPSGFDYSTILSRVVVTAATGVELSLDGESWSGAINQQFALGASVTLYARCPDGKVAHWGNAPAYAVVASDYSTLTFNVGSPGPMEVTAVALAPSTVLPARCYVLDGLVAQWDGIENIGEGLHDDAATTWVNLQDASSPMTLSGDYVWEDGRGIYFNKTATTGCGQFVAPATPGATGRTIETAACPTSGNTSGRFFGENSLPCLYLSSSQFSLWSVGWDAVICARSVFDPIGHFTTYGIAVDTATKKGCTYFDGAYYTAVQPSCTITYATALTSYLANRSGKDRATSGMFYALRIYDRVLSATEVEINSAFDRMRFQGATSNETGYAYIDDAIYFQAALSSGSGGSLTVDGETGITSTNIWKEYGQTPTISVTAVPASTHDFISWNDGGILTAEQRVSTSVTLSVSNAVGLKANFLPKGVVYWRYSKTAGTLTCRNAVLTCSKTSGVANGLTLTGVTTMDSDGLIDLGMPIICDEDGGYYELTTIGTVFKNNLELFELILPDSVTNIIANAVSGATKLRRVVLSSRLRGIGNSAFENCYELTSFEPQFPDTLETVGQNAFKTCSNLVGVAQFHGAISLGYDCVKTTKIGEVDLDGAPLKTFGAGSYASVTNFHPLLPATLEGTLPPSWNGWLLGGKQKLTLAAPNWTSLRGDNFRYMPWTEVDMTGSSIEKTGSWSFWGCSSLTSVTFSVAFNQFPNVNPAFGGCGVLKWVRFRGDPPEAITTNPFGGHTGMSYYLPKWNTAWERYLAGEEGDCTVSEMTSTECENFRAAHPGEPIPTQRLSIGGAGTKAISSTKGISWWYPDAPPVYREVTLFDLLGYEGKSLAYATASDYLLFDGTTYSYNATASHLALRWLAAEGCSVEFTVPAAAPVSRAMRLSGYRVHQLSSGDYANARAPTAWKLYGKTTEAGSWIELDSVTMTAESENKWAYLTNSTAYPVSAKSQKTPPRDACSLTYSLPADKRMRFVSYKFEPLNSYNKENAVADTTPYGLMELELLGELTTSEPNIDSFSVSRNGWNDLEFTFDLNSIGDTGADGRTPSSAVAWVELAAAGDTDFTNLVASSSAAAVTAGTGRLATVTGLSGKTTYEARLLVSNDLALVSTQKLDVAVSTLNAPFELGELTLSTNSEGRLTASLEVKALYVSEVTVDVAYRASIAAVVQNLGQVTVTEAGTAVLDSLTVGVTPTATSLVDATVTGDGIAQTVTSTPFGFWMADAATPTQISNSVTRATFAVTVKDSTNLTLSAIRDFGSSTSFDFTKLIAAPDGSPLALVSPGGVFNSNLDVVEVYLPDTVTAIPNSAFYNCARLQTFRLPPALTSIGNWAFSGCKKLQYVENLFPAACATIGNNAFSGCSKLPNFTLPPVLRSIQGGTFGGCSGFTDLVIPDSVTNIGGTAFQGTSSLTNVQPRFLPPQIRTASICCFHDQTNPKGPLVLDNPEMRTIPDDGFRYCYGITSVDMLGSSINYVGSLAFYSDNNIKWIRFATNSVNIVGSSLGTVTSANLRELIFPGDPPRLTGEGTWFSPSYYIIRCSRKNRAWRELLREHQEQGWLTYVEGSDRRTFRERFPNEKFPVYWLNLYGKNGKRYLKFFEPHGLCITIR